MGQDIVIVTHASASEIIKSARKGAFLGLYVFRILVLVNISAI